MGPPSKNTFESTKPASSCERIYVINGVTHELIFTYTNSAYGLYEALLSIHLFQPETISILFYFFYEIKYYEVLVKAFQFQVIKTHTS